MRSLPLNVIILHCHYERGGVTQVVENHVRALQDAADVERIVLVSGPRVSGLSAETQSLVDHIVLDRFDYDEPNPPANAAHERGQQIADRVGDALRDAGMDADSSVLHWHNHSLGKNTAAPAAIATLARSGWRLLLQIHDFAEDNRPQNYLALINAVGAVRPHQLDAYLYPRAPQIHYAGLTRADADVIAALGIPGEQTHCLPNSVTRSADQRIDRETALVKIRNIIGLPVGARWCLYPVRGIRRKNVGEFLLLSRWLGEQMFGGLTICPQTPIERRSYQRWRDLASSVAPRAVFDAAHHAGLSFQENLAASEYVLSTSVAEGFGMAFLEPWLAHRRVIARRLLTVTKDFTAAGVDLGQLYDQIPVPGDSAWLGDCRAEAADAFAQAWSEIPEDFRPEYQDLGGDDLEHIDFAKLTPARQLEVLQRAATDPGFESELQTLSKRLVELLQIAGADDHILIDHNAAVVAREYAVSKQADDLLSIYRMLLAARPAELWKTDGEHAAVDLVSRVRPFFPCRTELI